MVIIYSRGYTKIQFSPSGNPPATFISVQGPKDVPLTLQCLEYFNHCQFVGYLQGYTCWYCKPPGMHPVIHKGPCDSSKRTRMEACKVCALNVILFASSMHALFLLYWLRASQKSGFHHMKTCPKQEIKKKHKKRIEKVKSEKWYMIFYFRSFIFMKFLNNNNNNKKIYVFFVEYQKIVNNKCPRAA